MPKLADRITADAEAWQPLIAAAGFAVPISGFDNRPTWDNPTPKFDNRSTWDNWSKKR